MKTLRSYVRGAWHEADSGFVPLVDPSTEEEIGRVSSRGVDFAAVLEHARTTGGPALRELTFAERAGLLKAMSKVLREHRDELLELSRVNTGTTRADGAFDVDGGGGTLAWYAGFGRRLGERHSLVEGEGTPLARGDGFYGRHLLVPREGVAVAVNAFNFPVWGFAEKAACALLAGMPMIVKPATATAMVAERAVEVVVESGVLPEGALQLVCGSTGDLLDLLGPQDVFAFTGSAATARKLRERESLLAANTRVNVEADSLNAAVLAPDVEPDSPAWGLFLKDVVREMTQKTGQKCTAVRRVLVPREVSREVVEALVARLEAVVVGNPAAEEVTMGPVATADQLADTEAGVEELRGEAEVVTGGRRVGGVGAPEGKGFFYAPTLLLAGDPRGAEAVHRREVFAPVATVLPYDAGDGGVAGAREAAELVALGGGTLVTSAYTDDREWLEAFLHGAGPWTGRLYVGSEGSAGEAPGSGIALPQSQHGGPGRAGGGEELGGLVGVRLYLQRLAVQGSRGVVDRLAGEGSEGASNAS